MTDVTQDAAPTADTTAPVETAAPATGADAPQGDTAAPQADTPAADPAPDAPAVPDAYEFTVPEGMALDEKLVDKATPVLKELGLTNDQANKLVGVYAEHLAELAAGSGEAFEAAYAERRQAEVAAQVEADMTALKADKEIGGAQYEAVHKRVIDFIGAQGTPEFRAFVDSHGIGNNPEFVRVLDRAIRYTPTDTGETPAGAGGATPSFADRMYRYAEKSSGPIRK